VLASPNNMDTDQSSLVNTSSSSSSSACTPRETVERDAVPCFNRSADSGSGGSGVYVLTDCIGDSLQLYDGISNDLLWSAAPRSMGVSKDCRYYLPGLNKIYCRDLHNAIHIIELEFGHIRRVEGAKDFDMFIPSHDGSKFLLGRAFGKERVTELWRYGAGLHEIPMDWSSPFDSAHFSRNDTRVVTVDADSSIGIWDIESGKQTMRLPWTSSRERGDTNESLFLRVCKRHVDTHASLLAMCCKEDVKIWDLTTGAVRGSFTTSSATNAICISLERVIVAYNKFNIVCWNLSDGTERFHIVAADEYIGKILWAPAMEGFCTFSYHDRKVRHYDLTGQQLSCSTDFVQDTRMPVGLSTVQPEVILL
jgi:hypothetical protein